ncbi:MAG: hypothetical protein QOK37_1647 [Thermoanaerobaculia bacterium]|jgi:hypothetical protein|nr:hypothetical protein [Thermoanaerobaculia bacterium]
MADIRDSIKGAIDRALQAIENKPPAVKALMTSMPIDDAPDFPPDADSLPDDVQSILQRAREKLPDIEDHQVIGDFVHTDDGDVALLLSALEQATPPSNMKGVIFGTHKYDQTDPGQLLPALNMLIKKKVPFIGHQALTDFRVQMPEGDVSIAIAGDWGTGLFTSNQIALKMAAGNPMITLHLGDVYYSGTDGEIFDKFLGHFPHGSFASLALNSNHEMYSGGHGYFNLILKDPNFAARQKASYFCLFNSKWQIIGLDSAYDAQGGIHFYDSGNLRQTQLQWLTAQLQNGKANGRRSLIFTHHNPIGIRGKFDQHFLDQIIAAAQGNPFDYWYWGHEHDAAVYRAFPTAANFSFSGRCVGHGGVPYSPELEGDKGNKVFVEWSEQEKYTPPAGDARAGLNGFAVITLLADGSAVREVFYDDRGEQRYPPIAVAHGVVVAAPAQAPDKVIVTNRKRLEEKYGKRVAEVDAALTALVAGDQKRGLVTKVIAVDDPAAMVSVQGFAVADAASPQQNKDAVDAIYKAMTPDYIVLLGGPDVIPHQELRNPMHGGPDVDVFALSDLPYACDTPYSNQIEDFTGATRVVGRIGDLPATAAPGEGDPSLLVKGLETATNWKSKPASAYAASFGLSTVEWQQSTKLSLSAVFGAPPTLLLSPMEDVGWIEKGIGTAAHFINCHGAQSDSHFYGQEGKNFPISTDSSVIRDLVIAGKRFDGTLVAAECCYGSELYAPAKPNQEWAICARYIEGGAYAFFGSTTIAYGPANSNGQADILCQRFLRKAISGASTGRALLEARQEYVSNTTELGPQDLKTLAQFYLLGDPSITPVELPAAHAMFAPDASPAVARGERRRALAVRGEFLSEHRAVARLGSAAVGDIRAQLMKLAASYDTDADKIMSYSIERSGANADVATRFAAKAGGPNGPLVATNFHLMIAKRRMIAEGREHLPNVVAVVAKESNGQIISHMELQSK